MNNKRGWIRILEATLAVMLVSSVLIVIYTRQPDRSIDSTSYVSDIQREILSEIAINDTLRNEVLNTDYSKGSAVLDYYVGLKTPKPFNSRLVVCPITSPPTPCKLNETDFLDTRQFDLFVQETVISANVTDYSPRKIKLFVWEKI